MSASFLRQTVLLLLFGQALLGGLGWLLVGISPWAGLPVTLLLVWFIRRIGLIFREEAEKAGRRGMPVQLGRLALFAAVSAQVPGLLLLPYWGAPEWFLHLWQGAVMPVAAAIASFWPDRGDMLLSWLWVAAFLEIALFVWVAAAPARKAAPVKDEPAVPVKASPGEWVPARRASDVSRRGRRVR